MTEPDPWTCTVCGQEHPVPSIAEDCAKRHDQEVTDE